VIVSPTDVNVAVESDNERDTATCPTVIDAVVVSEPEVAVIVDDPFATAVTRPEELTVATAASDEDHVTV
jgi:hypothetical protein